MAQTLAVEAGYAAILSSNYSLALKQLEHARCIIWNQNLMLRSPLDQIQLAHPNLASRIRKVADELHSASSDSIESPEFLSSSMNPEEAGQQHRQIAKEYNELLTQVRTLPGFNNFLRPVKANRLIHAARNGPIVVINCHTDRWNALIVRPEQTKIMHVPLPNFNADKARTA